MLTEEQSCFDKIRGCTRYLREVHPFIDGNGRTGRLILNLEIMKNGYPPISVKFTDRKKYYECFHAYIEKGDASKMILMVSDYIEEELDMYLSIL